MSPPGIPTWQFLSQPLPLTLLTFTDRLYLACYLHPPNENTLFPYPEPPSPKLATKRSNRALASKPEPRRMAPFYFTVDDYLPYNAFHHDFGPLHIGHLYRFALEFHEILSCDEVPIDRPIVFWSRPDPRSKSPSNFIIEKKKITEKGERQPKRKQRQNKGTE